MNPALTGIHKTWVIPVAVGGTVVATFGGALNTGGGGLPGDGSDPPRGPDQNAVGDLFFEAEGASFTIKYHYETSTSGDPLTYKVGITVSVSAGHGGSTANPDPVFLYKTYTGPTANSYVTMGYPFSGTITFTIQTQEYIEETYSATDNQFYNGVPDSPVLTNCRIWERITQIDVAADMRDGDGNDLGGPSATLQPTAWTDMTYYSLATISATSQDATEGSWSIDPGGAYPLPVWPGSAGGMTTDNGTGKISGWCALDLKAANINILNGNVQTEAYMNNSVGISGSVYAMENAYPGNFLFKFTGIPGTTSIMGGSSAAAGGTQYGLAANGSVDNVEVFATNNNALDYAAVGITIDPSSLSSNNEDAASGSPLQTRLLIRGQSFPGISGSLAQTYPEPTGSWPSPAASITRTYSPEWPSGSYPYLRLMITGVGGSSMPGTITIPPCSVGVNGNPTFAPIESDVYSGPATPGKSWGFATAANSGDSVTIEIPLFAPDNLNSSPDTQDSDWPYPARRPLYAGVWRIPAITVALTSPSSGQTVQVTHAELFRSTSPLNVNFVSTWYHSLYSTGGDDDSVTPEWPLRMQPDHQVARGDEGTTDSNYFVRRGLLAVQDGIQSLEETDMYYIRTLGPSGNTGYQFDTCSIAEVVGFINSQVPQYTSSGAYVGMVDKHPGWTSAAGRAFTSLSTFVAGAYPADLPDETYYYNDSLPASSLAGSGVLRVQQTNPNGSPYWVLVPQFDLTTIGTSGQPLYDTLFTHPGWVGFDQTTWNGQTYGAGAYAAGILRGEAHGLVIQKPTTGNVYKSGQSGVEVDLRETDASGAARGSGITDDTGFYHTSGPAGHAPGVAHWVGISGSSSMAYSDIIGAGQWWSRHRHRVAFGPQSGSVGPIAIDSVRGWLHVAREKRISTYHIQNGNLAFSSPDYAVQSWVSLTYDTRRSLLMGIAQMPDNSYNIYVSRNGGVTATEVQSLAARSIQVVRDSERGYSVVLYEDESNGTGNTGVVQWQYSPDGGATWTAATPALMSDGSQITANVLSLAQDPRAGGVIVMAIKDTGGDSHLLQSTDTGHVWTLYLSDAGGMTSGFTGVSDGG